MDSNFWQITNDQTSKTVQKVKAGVQKYFIFIVLLFNIAFEVVARFYKFGTQALTPDFFVNYFITTFTSMLCFICFVPLAKNDEMRRSITYKPLVEEWNKLSTKVREGFGKLFAEFCKTRVEEERQDTKKFILANNTMIGFDEYKEKYETKSKKELKQLYINNELSKEDYKAILKCNRVKVKPINPLIVLNGAKKITVNDAGRGSNYYALIKILQRPFVILISSFIINTITTTFIGGNQDVVLNVMISLLRIVIASVCGYRTGVNDFKYEQDMIGAKVLFLSLFTKEISTVTNENNKDIRGTGVCADLPTTQLQS